MPPKRCRSTRNSSPPTKNCWPRRRNCQSLNEELTALNSQLQETLDGTAPPPMTCKNVALTAPTLPRCFLDLDLNIRFFHPRGAPDLSRDPDRCRPSAVRLGIRLERRRHRSGLGRAVLASSEPVEREIEGKEARWFLRRVQPYRAEGARVEGVVITYVDITERTAHQRRSGHRHDRGGPRHARQVALSGRRKP